MGCVAYLSVAVGICLLVSGTAGGECCKAHIGDPITKDNEAMWCENYCCHNSTQYHCCVDIRLRTDSVDRETLCGDFFRQHIWETVLIAFGCLIGLIVICGVCYCCCKKNCCRTFIYVKFK
ncbi:uncharacterized protein LOC117329400 [Pecten maximus]|uniref:uncharacterized protein LOC117329400 n=1 Tax=Pecten maximus TaxID=6579 RepID=UPI0014589BE2|nr:uncharacterized protein LOC117329400 [Pecten maximus]